MSVIINDLQTSVLNNPMFDAIRASFDIEFSSIDELTAGISLQDVDSYSIESYLVYNLFKKLEDDLGLDPDSVVREKVISHNFKTIENTKRFNAILESKPKILMSILEKARAILHGMLEDFSIFDIFPRYTLGATPSLKRGEDVLTRIKTGSGFQTLRLKFSDLEFGWLMSNLPHVEGGKSEDHTVFMCAPKTAKESRPIGLHEPYVLAVQAGTHDYLIKVLKEHCNIDFSNAQEKHKAYAEYYSVFNDYCTMDQSNASQNVLRTHCQYLLPENFFGFVDKICPRHLLIDDTLHYHEMMMAQGNGITSTLQSLIFYALISACAWKKNVSSEVLVFGDDAIFHSSLFGLVDQVFTSIGFEVNREKSFFSDSIRESCGGDYYAGVNVRPFYVKQLPNSIDQWYHICNGIFRVGYTNNNNCWRNSAFKHFWLRCIANIPSSERLFGPVGYGDSVLHCSDTSKYTIRDHKSGLKIKARVTRACEGGGKFDTLGLGIPGRVLFKAVSATSLLSGSGLTYSRIKPRTKDEPAVYGLRYPSILGIRQTSVKVDWIDYPISILSNQQDVDQIFSDLNLNSDEILQRYHQKLDYYRQVLISLLCKIMREKKLCKNAVQDIDLSL